ncbi:hypothetical protein EVG20_g11012 [Dentipellis fragilis]|uniref:Uncharacterized protein n=1 Tax=Dentipellis fragilis TaxID=205917 RepID=A0A4Y9XMU6_9AGAM|nr:hypothetical protein EVG20_g11012 [Dentipellis fragilis]
MPFVWYDRNELNKQRIARLKIYKEEEEGEASFLFPTSEVDDVTQIPEYDDAKELEARDELINAMGHGFTAENMQWVTVPGRKVILLRGWSPVASSEYYVGQSERYTVLS